MDASYHETYCAHVTEEYNGFTLYHNTPHHIYDVFTQYSIKFAIALNMWMAVTDEAFQNGATFDTEFTRDLLPLIKIRSLWYRDIDPDFYDYLYLSRPGPCLFWMRAVTSGQPNTMAGTECTPNTIAGTECTNHLMNPRPAPRHAFSFKIYLSAGRVLLENLPRLLTSSIGSHSQRHPFET